MKLPAFIYKNRFGTYYLRVLVSKQLRTKFDDTRKEIRVSLGTGKRREALEFGCGLYSEFQGLLSEMTAMTKLMWNGKEIDAVEWYERNTQRLKSEHVLKKTRNKQRIQGFFNDSTNALLTDDEKQLQIALGTRQRDQRIGKHRIDDVINAYISEKQSQGDWREKTEHTVRTIFKIFAEVMGDLSFDMIGYQEMNYYRQCVLKLPKNLNCERKFKGKSIKEIIEMQNMILISNKTRNKHFGFISSLFEWAVRRSFTDKNYAAGSRIKDRNANSKVRDIFIKEELQKIVSGDEYLRKNGAKHKKHVFFWAALLGMYTGGRLEEICQLKVSDIRQEEGIWYFAFCSEGEKVAKTQAAIRNVPVHEMLVKLGFLNYVRWQKRNKQERLFSDLIWHSKNGYGAQVTHWFNRTYLVKCGVKDEIKHKNIKVFHSFRHTVINHLEQRGVERNRVKSLEGHKNSELSYYQHGLGLKILSEEVVAKIDYEIDLSHLFDTHNNEYLKM